MACEAKWKIVDGEFRWSCSGPGLGKNLPSTINTCYKASCRGRQGQVPLSPQTLGIRSLGELVRQEHLKATKGTCGSLICMKPHESRGGNRFCSEECRAQSEKYQDEYMRLEMKRVGRPVLWVELECSMCGEGLRRKPWKVRQNKSGTFFCCRAHQEMYMLRYQSGRDEASTSAALLEKKSARDAK